MPHHAVLSFRPKLVLALALAGALTAPTGSRAEERFQLGVQTHFEQGWSLGWIDRAERLGATLLRDEIGWSDVETAAGSYDFATPDRYMRLLAERGMRAMIVHTVTNALYDDGNTPHSEDGLAGLATYLDAVLAEYPDLVPWLEIGNEVNAGDSTVGPFNKDAPRSLAATARAVAAATEGRDVRIACAGTNSISIGFLRAFFRYGGLEACDAISVHPYDAPPETVDLEIERLRAVMREMGGEKPVVVTEFGIWTEDPSTSPSFLVKSVAALASAGVDEAYWYALVDEPWWPNMGLYDPSGYLKPAGVAFAFLQDRVLPLGAVQDQSPTRAARIVSFGTEGQGFIVWGDGLPISVTGEAQAYDATGTEVDIPDVLTDEPVVLLGKGVAVTLDPAPPVVSSLYQFDTPPWSYFARRPGEGLTPLEHRDWEWATFRGAPDLSPLSVTANWVATARFSDGPFAAIERFTAPASGRYRITAWWEAADIEEPSDILLSHNGRQILQGTTKAGRYTPAPMDINLQAADTLDFEVAPAGPNGDGAVQRRIRIEGPLP